MRFGKILIASIAAAGLAAGLGADEGTAAHHHGPEGAENFGSVDFPVTCQPEALAQFPRAVAILHSFGYEPAEQAFRRIADADPACAMAYWGVAMSRYHPIWYPPTAADLAAGREAVARARALHASSEREQLYVAAIGSFYDQSESVDHKTRALRYEKAMVFLTTRFPLDREAAAFYALALLSTAPPTDKTYANQKKAAAILEGIFRANPKHPGAAHYIIHSFDSPALAPLALNAARSYAQIAPSAPHALHMPSHIFTRLGLWEDSISSNRASAASAVKAAKLRPGVHPSQQLHALDYLAYAFLQEARDDAARSVLEEIRGMSDVEPRDLSGAFAFSAIPVRFALERGRFDEAANLELHPAAFPWNDFPFAEAMNIFARAIGQARLRHAEAARRELARMSPVFDRAVEVSKQGYDWASQVQILRHEAEGWTAQAERKPDEALREIRAAAELEDSTEKHPVTPGAVIPAHEFLGDLLLEQGKPAEALAEYEVSLKSAPNRFHGLAGAFKAAGAAGNRAKEQEYRAKLVELGSHADTARPELARARAGVTEK